jgi:hypothetical protein
MDFVAVLDNEPVCRLSGCSDVIHLDGIGGFGDKWLEKNGGVPDAVPPAGWTIDCMRVSGLLRLFCTGRGRLKLRCAEALSSFEVFAIRVEE